MSKEFRFPDLGEGVAEGELVKWLVKEGDAVQEDQDVAEVETDKALVSIPSPLAGVVEKRHFKEGDKVPVGATLLTFSDGEEKMGASLEVSASPPEKSNQNSDAPAPPKEKQASAPPSGEAKPPQEPSSEPPAEPRSEPPEETPSEAPKETPSKPPPEPAKISGSSGAKVPVLATPHTRKLAREMGVDIEGVSGSGEHGRVTEEDLKKHASSTGTSAPATPLAAVKSKEEAPKAKNKEPVPATPEIGHEDFGKYGPVEKIAVKGIRRKISEHMLKAAHETVMVTHIDEAEVDSLLQLRKDKKKFAEERGVKLTLLPFLLKACVIALKNYPYLNASLSGDEIILKNYYHFGFAVDTEAGLMVPVIRDVDQKSIMRIAIELESLSKKARDRSISLEDLKGHSFSVTNIGSIGGKAFTPILHYPDSAILGLGRTYQKPVVKDGEVKIASVLPLCLTFDHRVTDGATAARFTNEVIKYLSDPDLLLLDDGEA